MEGILIPEIRRIIAVKPISSMENTATENKPAYILMKISLTKATWFNLSTTKTTAKTAGDF